APLQEGILFHHMLDPEGVDPYVLSLVLQVSDQQEVEALLQALQAVMDRHDVLRTAVMWEGLPRPVQVVQRQARLPVRELPPQETTHALQALVQGQRLDVKRAPLMQVALAAV